MNGRQIKWDSIADRGLRCYLKTKKKRWIESETRADRIRRRDASAAAGAAFKSGRWRGQRLQCLFGCRALKNVAGPALGKKPTSRRSVQSQRGSVGVGRWKTARPAKATSDRWRILGIGGDGAAAQCSAGCAGDESCCTRVAYVTGLGIG